jgi:hypothetical protein
MDEPQQFGVQLRELPIQAGLTQAYKDKEVSPVKGYDIFGFYLQNNVILVELLGNRA